MVKIGINGFGRIGRLILRALLENYKDALLLIEWPELISKKPKNLIKLFFSYEMNFKKYYPFCIFSLKT